MKHVLAALSAAAIGALALPSAGFAGAGTLSLMTHKHGDMFALSGRNLSRQDIITRLPENLSGHEAMLNEFLPGIPMDAVSITHKAGVIPLPGELICASLHWPLLYPNTTTLTVSGSDWPVALAVTVPAGQAGDTAAALFPNATSREEIEAVRARLRHFLEQIQTGDPARLSFDALLYGTPRR